LRRAHAAGECHLCVHIFTSRAAPMSCQLLRLPMAAQQTVHLSIVPAAHGSPTNGSSDSDLPSNGGEPSRGLGTPRRPRIIQTSGTQNHTDFRAQEARAQQTHTHAHAMPAAAAASKLPSTVVRTQSATAHAMPAAAAASKLPSTVVCTQSATAQEPTPPQCIFCMAARRHTARARAARPQAGRWSVQQGALRAPGWRPGSVRARPARQGAFRAPGWRIRSLGVRPSRQG